MEVGRGGEWGAGGGGGGLIYDFDFGGGHPTLPSSSFSLLSSICPPSICSSSESVLQLIAPSISPCTYIRVCVWGGGGGGTE